MDSRLLAGHGQSVPITVVSDSKNKRGVAAGQAASVSRNAVCGNRRRAMRPRTILSMLRKACGTWLAPGSVSIGNTRVI